MPELKNIPTSAFDMVCAVCNGLERVIVCYCGRDIGLPCLAEHQSRCAYTEAGIFQPDEQRKRKKRP